MKSFILKFGKYKGQQFSSTPKSYQEWLLSQDWFKAPASSSNLSMAEKTYSQAANNAKLANYSDRTVDNLFEAEKMLDDAYQSSVKYAGMNPSQKQAAMKAECDEIVADNEVYDYYNQ